MGFCTDSHFVLPGFVLCFVLFFFSLFVIFGLSLLQSLSTLSHLVANLSKLAQLDVSRNGYNLMPPRCSWPSTLQYLNISGSKLIEVTACMPTTLQVRTVKSIIRSGFGGWGVCLFLLY